MGPGIPGLNYTGLSHANPAYWDYLTNQSLLLILFSRIHVKNEEKEEKIMKWYYYVILLFVYIGYLAVGAAVFRFFEKPHEQAKCEKAKEGKFSEITKS